MLPLLVTEFAPAKVNLTLHVTGQRSDGYHLLDSLVVFCGIGDWVTVQPATALGLHITGTQAGKLTAADDNLVLLAARLIAPQRGAGVVLNKHLPLASGIGGGSADAAATLRALTRLWDLPLPDAVSVLTLGADVPVCLAGHPARMQGIGDRVTPVQGVPRVHIVLVNPGIEVPTGAVFNALSSKHNPPMPDQLPAWRDGASLAHWLATQRNDLEAPARAVAPVIDAVLAAVSAQRGALIARMSGSGATCFGLFQTAAEAQGAAQAIGAAQPQWWVAAGPVYAGPVYSGKPVVS